MKLRQALTSAAAKLAANRHLRESASRDAELLLLNVLGITRAQLFLNSDRELTPEDEYSFTQNLNRRAANEPVQYILGHQEFYGFTLQVNSSVLIPRPETEHLVEAVLQLLPANQPLKLADIGTGSGAIAIALAIHLPQAGITALDLSTEALALARQNAETNNVTGRIKFLQSDLLSAVNHEPETFDAIVSNPPYIAESDRDSLHPQVRDYEPTTALFAGETGLDIYRRLVPQSWEALKPNGLLALEIGHGQQDAIAHLLQKWRNIAFVNDLQQIPRVALARRPA